MYFAGSGIVHSAQEEYLQTDDSQFGLLTTTGPNALTIAKLANPGMHFDQPFRELFIWAVLNEKYVKLCITGYELIE